MPGLVVSVVLQQLEQIDSVEGGVDVHGANLGISHVLKKLIADPRLEAIEFYLPPVEYQRRELMGQIAGRVLPVHLRGKGVLRFYPIHALPEVWQDPTPRILLTVDVALMARDRYLRDRFATGPTPIWAMTHGMGHLPIYEVLHRVAHQARVPYDAIGCLSNACRDHIRATFNGYISPAGAPEPFKLEFFPNTVDTEQFRPATQERQTDARRLLRLPTEGTITLYLGRLTPNTKADLMPLVRQFAAVAGPTDHLVLAGFENSPGYLARLKQEADTCGVGDRFLAINKVEPWSRSLYYAAADIFACPSDNVQECMNNTILEAMSAGLPVITTDWDGMRDMVIEGETGYFIETAWMPGLNRIDEMSPAVPFTANFLLLAQNVWTNNDQLRERLQALLQSPQLRKQLGTAGRERILKVFTWDIASNLLFGYWQDMLREAQTETTEQRDQRRQDAQQLGLPIPFQETFANYATTKVNPQTAKLRLSPFGSQVAKGEVTLQFYDETLPLIRPDIIDELFDIFKKNGLSWTNMQDLATMVAPRTGSNQDAILFHLGLLVKRDVLQICFN